MRPTADDLGQTAGWSFPGALIGLLLRPDNGVVRRRELKGADRSSPLTPLFCPLSTHGVRPLRRKGERLLGKDATVSARVAHVPSGDGPASGPSHHPANVGQDARPRPRRRPPLQRQHLPTPALPILALQADSSPFIAPFSQATVTSLPPTSKSSPPSRSTFHRTRTDSRSSRPSAHGTPSTARWSARPCRRRIVSTLSHQRGASESSSRRTRRSSGQRHSGGTRTAFRSGTRRQSCSRSVQSLALDLSRFWKCSE